MCRELLWRDVRHECPNPEPNVVPRKHGDVRRMNPNPTQPMVPQLLKAKWRREMTTEVQNYWEPY
jgi:hypothetical protein